MEGLVTERNAMPARGPRFFRAGDEIMFEFVIDAGNIIGPRPALKTDSEKHPEAWVEFAAAADEPEETEPAPGPREPEPHAEPETRVEPKDMDKFAARLAPAPEKPKRQYVRRKAV